MSRGVIFRWLKRLLFPAAVSLALVVLAVILMGEVSSQPRFCGTCHVMEPYYRSWHASPHKEVACVECHIAPGIRHLVRKKWEALSMVASYFTGTYGTRPWAQVEDAACLNCHPVRLLSGRQRFGRAFFSHAPHLVDLGQGMKLRCTSCHSQLVEERHIAVSATTCILCHFKREKGEGKSGRCSLCHELPGKATSPEGFSFDHRRAGAFDISCRSCHSLAATGAEGSVPAERCLACHNEASLLRQRERAKLLHQTHVQRHKVECLNCHLEIQHGARPPTRAASSCSGCHAEKHPAEQQLFAGYGGRGVEEMPSLMWRAGLTCRGCHTRGARQRAAEADFSCMSCHGPSYRSIFRLWSKTLKRRLALLGREVKSVTRALQGRPSRPLEEARHNLSLVQTGNGLHNVRYALALLSRAHEFLNQVRREKGWPGVALPWARVPYASPCLRCHEGIEDQSGTFASLPFDHARHVGRAALECRACHRPHRERAAGEVVRYGPSGCRECHHRRPARPCLGCHARIRTALVPSFRGQFSHDEHLDLGLGCADCHSLRRGEPARLERTSCGSCHETDGTGQGTGLSAGECRRRPPLRSPGSRLPG